MTNYNINALIVPVNALRIWSNLFFSSVRDRILMFRNRTGIHYSKVFVSRRFD
jgi:hypothetical protein